MITVDSSGNPLSGAFANAMQQPQVGFDMALYIAGSGIVSAGIKRAVLELGAGYAMDELQTFTPCQLMSTQFEAQLYGLSWNIMGARVEVRVGVWTGSSYEYVTVAHITITEQSTWQGITTIKGKGILSLTNVPIPLAEGDYTPAQIAAAVLSATGITVDIGSFSSLQNAHVGAGMTCRDALASLCARLGGHACELNGSISVRPYSSATTYTIPVDYVRDADLGSIGYTVDGITVEAAGESFAYGTGRVHIEDPTATASTSAVTWGNISSYWFMPGSLKAAIIDPRVTPADTVLFEYTDGGSTYSYSIPARGISITYDGGYFGNYMASGLTAQSEAELVDGPLSSRVASAYELAAEAEQIAAATGQYFWHDTNGAHISTEALDPAGAQNTLWNTEGMLFRRETDNLLAILAGETAATSGMAVYDGQGNDGSNIVASFTGSGVTVGRDGEQHVEIATESTDFFNVDGTLVGRIGSGETETIEYTRWTGIIIDEQHDTFSASATFSPLPDFTAGNLKVSDDPQGPGLQPGLFYWNIELSDFGTVSDPDQGVTVTATRLDSRSWSLEVSGDGNSNDMPAVYARYMQSGSSPYYIFGTGYATGSYAFAEGLGTTATSWAAHAEGGSTQATGDYSHAEGNGTQATDEEAHAEGYLTVSSGIRGSHAEGEETTASGRASHAEGRYNTASGDSSHAAGWHNTASGDCQTVIGKYSSPGANDAFVIGNGSVGAPGNAMEVDWDGNMQLPGTSTAAAHNGFRGRKNLASTDDIDALYTTGIYYVGGNSVGGTLPSGVTDYFSLITMGGSSETSTGYVGKQVLLTGSTLYVRSYAGIPRAWTAWVQMVGGIPVSVANGGTGASTASPNRVFAGPSSGTSAAAPSFRALVAADIPNHAASKITSGTLALARGGTAADNTACAINTVFAGPSSGNAGNASWRKLVAADIPNHSTAKLTSGTLGIARGGTGSTAVTSVVNTSTVTMYVWGPVVMIQLHGVTKAPDGSAIWSTAYLANYKPGYNISAIVAATTGELARAWVSASDGKVYLSAVNTTASKAWYGTLTYIYMPA
ncbi:MAG: hypothetical protein IKG69_08720 [Atopobiaceae bacterium]|nr:hypothetical protein [Atopobiaceae bacterium]